MLGRAARFSYTLDRAATVAIVVRRALAGRRVGGVCRKPTRANSRARSCRRYVTVGRTSAGGQAGTNRLAIGASTYRRRAALYRLSATPSAGDRKGTTRTIHFRVKR
jgi:hypothetical protein